MEQDFYSQFAPPPVDPRVKQAKEQAMAALLRRVQSGPPVQPIPAPQIAPVMNQEQMDTSHRRMQNEQIFGRVLQASGDKALSPLGKSMAARDPERWKQNQMRANQVARYQNWQMNASNRPKDDASFLVKSIEALNDMEDHGGGKNKMPSGWGEKLMYDANQIRSLGRAVGTLDSAYTQATGQAIGLAGYSGPLEGFGRWMTQNTDKLTTPEMKAAAQYWADLEANVIAPWRHELFGATLTDGEKQAFAALANLTPGMPKTEVEKRLKNLEIARIEGARDRSVVTIENYGRGYLPMLKKLYGGSLNNHNTVSYEKEPGSTTEGGVGIDPDLDMVHATFGELPEIAR